MRNKLNYIALAIFVLTANMLAENWPQWRGPYFNGSTTEKNLPAGWDADTNNILWVAPMPGVSAATPAVWEDSVFVSTPDEQQDLYLLCIDAKNGKTKWQKKVSTGNRVVNLNNMASPSPVTDGKIVISMFGTGDTAAFDFNGNLKWQKSLATEYGKFAIMYLYGCSPMLYQGKLYIQVLQRNNPKAYPHSNDNIPTRESFLLCLDPETGKTLWRHIRSTDAINESMESYATPIPNNGINGLEILVVGGDYLTAHNPQTGEEIWRCGGINPRQTETEKNWFRIVPSPVPANNIITVCSPKDHPVIGIKDGGKGLVTESNIVWICKETTSDWSTPLFYKNKLFVVNGARRILSCLDPSSGKVLWSGNLGVSERVWSSPTGADDKIYLMSEKGTLIVCEAGEQFKIISTNPLQESPTKSSVAVSNGRLFLRTAKNLYCIGKK
ncbi:MAG: PQQ-binding-like beta-propeller repeat protein [Verrucomicrobiia bacterium]